MGPYNFRTTLYNISRAIFIILVSEYVFLSGWNVDRKITQIYLILKLHKFILYQLVIFLN